jgi:hypothetical protein
VKHLFEMDTTLPANRRALLASAGSPLNGNGVLTIWRVVIQNSDGMTTRRIVPIAIDGTGQRRRDVEIGAPVIRNFDAASVPFLQPEQRGALLNADLPEIVRRDLAFRGHLSESSSISSRLLAWIEIGNGGELR